MNLPDVNECYPQTDMGGSRCCDDSSCDTDIYENDEVIEHNGYIYCSGDCLVRTMLDEGHALKVTVGGLRV